MTHALIALVIGLSLAGGTTRALAGGLAPGCLPEDSRGLRRVAVRFGGLAPAESVVRFYEYLRLRGALPCRRITLDEKRPTLSHALMASEHRVTPAPYVTAMDALVCQLNPDGCTKGRPTATTFVVPDLHLASYFPAWTSVPLDPDEAPDDDLEGVLGRHHASLPDQVDSRPEKIDRAEWLATIRKANFGFTRWVTKGVQSQSGARLKQRQLVVPVTEYRGTISLPAAVAKTPQKAFGIPDFACDPVVTLWPSVRTSGTGAGAPLGARFEAALQMISMPPKLPPAESDSASILLADRGIDAECLFLHPERDVPPDVLQAATAGNPACTATAHGTHVWGIIGGRIPDVMRGVALIEQAAPTIQFWDFDKQTPGQSPDFFDFVNGAVGSARVANFSFDFRRDLTPSQADRITEMIQGTPSILYVVAAENRLAKYRRGGSFALPVGLNAEDNVLVVTALNEAGTGVWDSAARNNSEVDDVVLLAAPGVGIPSACAGNRVGVLDGTSQATAFVSGVAALLVRDGLDVSLLIKRRLAYTADVLPGLVDGVAGGRLNVGRALGARRDKLCDLGGGDGTACDPWTHGVAHLGYKTTAGFTSARTVVLKKSGGQTIEVSPAVRLLRIAKASDEGFVVFYLEPDEARSDRLRRKRVAALEAFSDKDHHGSLVIRLDLLDGTAKDVELETLGDFVRRGA